MKEVKEVVDTESVALANGQPEEAGNVVIGGAACDITMTNTVEEMKLWLLKQKQTQQWNSPVATADAVLTLLMIQL